MQYYYRPSCDDSLVDRVHQQLYQMLLLHSLLQALCKLSELDSSEISKEYKDPADAYVIGDTVRGNGGIVFFLLEIQPLVFVLLIHAYWIKTEDIISDLV